MDDIPDTDRIEQDLARTRARMDSRLDALQNHLTPKQMLNDAFSYFRGGEGADFTNQLITRAKANPIPVALVGVGVVWLMAGSQETRYDRAPMTTPYDDFEAKVRSAEGNVERYDHDDDDSYAERLQDARGQVVGITRDASDTAASYAQRVKDAISSAAQSVREKSHDLTSGASDALGRLGTGAGDRAASIQQGTRSMSRSSRNALSSVAGNPFALGAAAALVGLVAGALIPTSEEEEAVLGSTATKLRTAGLDLAQDVADRGGRVASDALGAVKQSAEAHGLATDKPVGELLSDVKTGALVDNVRQVAQEAGQAGSASASTHFGNDGTSQHS